MGAQWSRVRGKFHHGIDQIYTVWGSNFKYNNYLELDYSNTAIVPLFS